MEPLPFFLQVANGSITPGDIVFFKHHPTQQRQVNVEGQITDFEVMVRPASGLQALGAAMAQQLASTVSP